MLHEYSDSSFIDQQASRFKRSWSLFAASSMCWDVTAGVVEYFDAGGSACMHKAKVHANEQPVLWQPVH